MIETSYISTQGLNASTDLVQPENEAEDAFVSIILDCTIPVSYGHRRTKGDTLWLLQSEKLLLGPDLHTNRIRWGTINHYLVDIPPPETTN